MLLGRVRLLTTVSLLNQRRAPGAGVKSSRWRPWGKSGHCALLIRCCLCRACGQAAYVLRGLACLPLGLGKGIGGGPAVFLGFLLFVLGPLELLARLLHLLLGGGHPLAGLLNAFARPLQPGVDVRSPCALFAQALLGGLGCLLHPDQLLLAGAAPLGEFALGGPPPRRRPRAAPGVRPLGRRCGAGVELRWRSEGIDQAAFRPLVGCVRIGEHGAQGRFEVLPDRLRECPASRASSAACRDRAATTRRRCAERSLRPSASRAW